MRNWGQWIHDNPTDDDYLSGKKIEEKDNFDETYGWDDLDEEL